MAILTPQQKAEFVGRIVEWLHDNDELHAFIAEASFNYLPAMRDNATDAETDEQIERSYAVRQEITEAVFGAFANIN
jgi:hypothetical protein